MIASSGKRTDAAVAIQRQVRVVGETLTSQERGLLFVVGNGDGREPLVRGEGICFEEGGGWGRRQES